MVVVKINAGYNIPLKVDDSLAGMTNIDLDIERGHHIFEVPRMCKVFVREG